MQGYEIIIVAVLLLLLFGGSQLPKLARSLGEARRELKAGMAEGDDEKASADEDAKQ